METIKINGNSYDMVANGWQLDETGGRIVFQPGSRDFASVLADLQATKSLDLVDDTGSVIASRSDLVYAGRLQLDRNWVIGSEQYSVAGDGPAVYKDIIGTAIIADFREPDVREKLAEMNARLDYVAMMTDVDMEV